jgi:hypothetical protein
MRLYKFSNLVLKPKDKVVAKIDIGRMYDISYPGTYSITAQKTFLDKRGSSLFEVHLETASPLQIKINAPDPLIGNGLTIVHADGSSDTPVPIMGKPSAHQ